MNTHTFLYNTINTLNDAHDGGGGRSPANIVLMSSMLCCSDLIWESLTASAAVRAAAADAAPTDVPGNDDALLATDCIESDRMNSAWPLCSRTTGR